MRRTIGALFCLVALAVGSVKFTAVDPVLAQDDTGSAPDGAAVHVVQPRETLVDIARLYGTTPEAIAAANNLAAAVDIFVGQRLLIPARESALGASSHVVGAGDSLSILAARYGVSPEWLAEVNRIVNPALLYAGQSLFIPSVSEAAPGSVTLVRVESGSSLWQLALRSNTRVTALAALNGIADLFVVAPGRAIAIPAEFDSGLVVAEPWKSITLHPIPLEPGRTAALVIDTTVPGTATALFLGREIPVVSDGAHHTLVFGVHRWTAPGLYPMTVTFQDEAGRSSTYTRQLLVGSGGYAQEVIRLSDEDAAALGDQQAVEEELAYIRERMTGYTPQRRWSGLFRLPAAGVMSSAFGTARAYGGGDFDAFHTGADFAAPTGTPIYAPADGVVVDTGELAIRGFATIIDHGWGVYTGYWHQSSILVNPGDSVTAGQPIGTIGSTGLSTAAHVHWEMWVTGVQVDPLQWAREAFP